MNYNTLNIIISNNIGKANLADPEDRIIYGCLLYRSVHKLISSGSIEMIDADSLIESIYKKVLLEFNTMQQSYVFYHVMKSRIKYLNKSSFSAITEKNIEFLLDGFNTKRIEPFSTTQFSQYMYNISNLTLKEHNRLSQIHFNIMVPIAKYYMENYNVSSRDIVIYNVLEVPNNPGKII